MKHTRSLIKARFHACLHEGDNADEQKTNPEAR